MENMLLIDGNSLLNRAFYALPPLSNSKGEPTQAVYGFTTMLIKAIADFKPAYIAVAFDLPKPTFRHERYGEYKAGRKKMPEELAVQLPLLKEELKLMNIAIVEATGYEADDIIGTLSARNDVMTYIITGDRDSLQLINDTTRVVLTKRGITETVILDEKGLKEMFSLTPKQVIDFKALAGDSSDNIPGIAGIGEKTAVSLLESYGSLEGIYANADEITGKLGERIRLGRASAELSYYLATIKTDVPVENKLELFTFDSPFGTAVRTFFAENAFKSLVKRDELFVSSAEPEPSVREHNFIREGVVSPDRLTELLSGVKRLSVTIGETISFSTDGEREYVIAVKRTLIDDGMDYTTAIKTLAPVLRDGSVEKIVFDGKALKKQLAPFGAELNGYGDVRLMQFISDMRVSADTPAELAEHAGYDKEYATAAMLLYADELVSKLTVQGLFSLYNEVELPLESVLYDMETRGVKIDTDLLSELGRRFTETEKELTERIHALAGRKFNVNSPKQLASVLFEELGIEYPKRSKKHSTSAEILELIEDKHEIVPLVTQHRFIAKLNSTYVDGLSRLLCDGDVVHTDYKQMLTTTGRLSSVEPNLQNIPVRTDEGRALRGLFVARNGYTLVSADYSQIELRLLAHFSGDEKLRELYLKGEDIHARTAAEVFGVPLSEVTKDMRRQAKAVNFGIIYGMSEYGLSQSIKCAPSTAKKYMTTYFSRFSSVKPYFDGIIANAKKTGYTTTLLGRIRYIPELSSPNAMVRQFGERAAMNAPLQGSAADIIKLAMVTLYERLKDKRSRLILQIHDELIVEAADDEVDEICLLIKESMENAVKLSVPLPVEVKKGKSWLEC